MSNVNSKYFTGVVANTTTTVDPSDPGGRIASATKKSESNPIVRVADFGLDTFAGVVNGVRDALGVITHYNRAPANNGGSNDGEPPPTGTDPVVNGDAPSDVAAWAAELGLGGYKSVASASGTNNYSFDHGSISVDPNTGYITELDVDKMKIPRQVAELSIQANLGVPTGTAPGPNGETTFTFKNGSILAAADGTIEGETESTNNRDAVMANVGKVLGFGANPPQVSVDNANQQKVYTFDNGTVYTDKWTGSIVGGQTKSGVRFTGDILNVAFSRGFGAFQSASDDSTGAGKTFMFSNGTVHVAIDASNNWTVDSAKFLV